MKYFKLFFIFKNVDSIVSIDTLCSVLCAVYMLYALYMLLCFSKHSNENSIGTFVLLILIYIWVNAVFVGRFLVSWHVQLLSMKSRPNISVVNYSHKWNFHFMQSLVSPNCLVLLNFSFFTLMFKIKYTKQFCLNHDLAFFFVEKTQQKIIKNWIVE